MILSLVLAQVAEQAPAVAKASPAIVNNFQIALLAFKSGGWIVALIGAAPALLTFGFRLFVPESEKWQASVKADTAKADPLKEVFGPKLWKTTLIATALSSVALIGTWGSVQWLPLWADKMAGAADPTAKGWTGMSSGIGAVVGCLAGAYFGGFISRRLGQPTGSDHRPVVTEITRAAP